MKKIIIWTAALMTLAALAFAAQPNTINYQGYLKNGAVPASGPVSMKFSLYSSNPARNNPVWQETQPVVAITSGIYSVQLGSVEPILAPFDAPYYLGLNVAGSGEMPLQLLSSTGYAFRAAVADNVSSAGTIVSTIATGTPPLQVSSVTLVPNLNADLLDGRHGDEFVLKAGDAMTGDLSLSSLTASGNLYLPLTTPAAGVIYSGAKTLIHGYGIGNFSAGPNAGNLTTSGVLNTASGASALFKNSDGSQNTAAGAMALSLNTSGSDNTATGMSALYKNILGSQNTANGSNALFNNTTGNENTAIGYEALKSNISGSWNTATGRGALSSNSNGNYLTAVGYKALFSNTSGDYNTAIGASALQNNTGGTQNTSIGDNSLSLNTTGSYNTATGVAALNVNTTGGSNTATGSNALNFNTTGSFNTASGAVALRYNSTGSQNTAIGYASLNANSDGDYNTAIGSQALGINSSGRNNTAIGYLSLFTNSTGYKHTAIGSEALYSNTTGLGNSASGFQALYSNTTGTGNTAIGFHAGFNQTTGSYNIYVGQASGVAGESFTTRIGLDQTAAYLAGVSGSTAASGVGVLVNASGKLGTLTSSRRFKEEIADMGDATGGLMKLRPVSFRYKPEYADGSRLLQYGLIAEEVAEIFPGLVQYGEKGEVNTVYYQFLAPMLLNEYQKQQKKIQALEERLERLEKALAGR